MKQNFKKLTLVIFVSLCSLSCGLFGDENESDFEENGFILCDKLNMKIPFWESSFGLSNKAIIEEGSFLLGENSCITTIKDEDVTYSIQISIDTRREAIDQYKRSLASSSNSNKIADFDPNVFKEDNNVWLLVQNDRVIIMQIAKLRGITVLDEDKYETWLKQIYDQVKSKL